MVLKEVPEDALVKIGCVLGGDAYVGRGRMCLHMLFELNIVPDGEVCSQPGHKESIQTASGLLQRFDVAPLYMV